MKTRILSALASAAAVMALPSCAGLTSGLTGQPIPTTPVSRTGGVPFDVATSDVLRAEASPPGTAWGLYNAGATAERAREIIDLGK